MRGLFLLFLLCLSTKLVRAQQSPAITFHGQFPRTQAVPVELYALFYEDPTGDTLQPPEFIAGQHFLPADSVPQARIRVNRQMPQTSQVIWVQFKITNTHPSDTLHLLYAGGIHAVFSLYQKKDTHFINKGRNGLCVPAAPKVSGYGILPLVIPPQTTQHYLVRVADYLVMFDNAAGQLFTHQGFQAALAKELVLERWLLGAMAIILGGVMLMGGYSFFQYWLTRDKAFLYYFLYTVAAACFILLLTNPRFSLGLTPMWLPWLGHPISLSLNPLLALLYAMFLVNLLHIQKQQPVLWRLIQSMMMVLVILQCVGISQVFMGIWIKSNPVYFALDTLPALVMGILLIVATLRSDSKLKRYLLAGQISLYVIAISPVHGMFSLARPSAIAHLFLDYPPFYMSLGLCMELFCFALALAYRSKLVEVEKKELQETYTRQLKSELEARTRQVQTQSKLLGKQHIRQLEVGFEQQLAEVQMSALRAQMNPHFIFNCLNSIQLYTTSNNSAKASEYLNRFSQLIRLVLENSRSERVTLSNELEALQLYLEMEAMRFKNKLRFTIDIPSSLDTDLIEIPPLLLQPYVENAIWHGLMHKAEGGHVSVKVEMPVQDCLKITITDDGVGRAIAAELKSKSATRHKSFGMKLTGERITLINRLYQIHTQVKIHDLTDAEGKAAGTEVVLEIPI
jgi:hypothetical protein